MTVYFPSTLSFFFRFPSIFTPSGWVLSFTITVKRFLVSGSLIPTLFLPGDTYANRMPDPVLQQVEHFNNPGITANDAFKPVTKYFDRITRPEQILQTLPQAIQTMLDPADCGPACISLCQDVQGEVYEYPE